MACCRPGDVFVICSDGLTAHVEDGEILQHVAGRVAAGGLRRPRGAYAAARRRRDNVTVVVVQHRRTAGPRPKAGRTWQERLGAIRHELRPVASGSRLSSQVPAGTRLNGIFEIDAPIGAGGMGEIYKGHTIQTGDARRHQDDPLGDGARTRRRSRCSARKPRSSTTSRTTRSCAITSSPSIPTSAGRISRWSSSTGCRFRRSCTRGR